MVAAGALGAALAVGGVAYAANDPDSDGGQQIVRVVEDDGGTAGYDRDCPDKSGGETPNNESPSNESPAGGGDGL
jgi:hypothetical protein